MIREWRKRRLMKKCKDAYDAGYEDGINAGYAKGLKDGNPFSKISEKLAEFGKAMENVGKSISPGEKEDDEK